MNFGDWIVWDGDDIEGPIVPDGIKVQIQMRSQTREEAGEYNHPMVMKEWDWDISDSSGDILAYRVASTILPCPFCGGRGIPHIHPDKTCDIYCESCDVRGPLLDGLTMAKEFWNTRDTRCAT